MDGTAKILPVKEREPAYRFAGARSGRQVISATPFGSGGSLCSMAASQSLESALGKRTLSPLGDALFPAAKNFGHHADL